MSTFLRCLLLSNTRVFPVEIDNNKKNNLSILKLHKIIFNEIKGDLNYVKHPSYLNLWKVNISQEIKLDEIKDEDYIKERLSGMMMETMEMFETYFPSNYKLERNYIHIIVVPPSKCLSN
jgi:hypothetical protein